MGLRAAVYQDSREHSVKQVSGLMLDLFGEVAIACSIPKENHVQFVTNCLSAYEVKNN